MWSRHTCNSCYVLSLSYLSMRALSSVFGLFRQKIQPKRSQTHFCKFITPTQLHFRDARIFIRCDAHENEFAHLEDAFLENIFIDVAETAIEHALSTAAAWRLDESRRQRHDHWRLCGHRTVLNRGVTGSSNSRHLCRKHSKLSPWPSLAIDSSCHCKPVTQ